MPGTFHARTLPGRNSGEDWQSACFILCRAGKVQGSAPTGVGATACDERILIPSALNNPGIFTMAFRPLPAQATTKLLREAKPLQSLFNEAQRLAQLQQLLDSQLQPAARPHCRVASWRGGNLLLVLTDAHWATRLRYQQKRLLRQLQMFDEFAGLQHILFKVQPQVERQAPVRTHQLSPAAAETLQEAAEGIANPRLRAALERLASRSRPRED